jgi:hypothetical protein
VIADSVTNFGWHRSDFAITTLDERALQTGRVAKLSAFRSDGSEWSLKNQWMVKPICQILLLPPAESPHNALK